MQYTAEDFVKLLYANGFNFFTGVPCSNQRELLEVIQHNPHHYYSLNPGIAIALSAGASFAGRLPVILAQNTEIGDMMAHMMMLFSRYELSGLLLTSYRKTYSEIKWGSKGASLNNLTLPLIELLDLEHVLIKDDNYAELEVFVSKPISGINCMILESNIFENLSICDYLNKAEKSNNTNAIAGEILTNIDQKTKNALTEAAAISMLAEYVRGAPSTAAIVSEGQLSRKFFEEADLPNVLPLSCGLGYTSSIGAGIALCTTKTVLVTEGDGGFLMNLSIMPFVGSQKINNFIHVIINNGCYVSTGGQAIVNNSIGWDNVAISFGYASAISIFTEEDLAKFLANIDNIPKPIFVNLQVFPSVFSSPAISKPPGFFGARFKEFLSRGNI